MYACNMYIGPKELFIQLLQGPSVYYMISLHGPFGVQNGMCKNHRLLGLGFSTGFGGASVGIQKLFC